PIAAPLQRSGLFPPLLVQMVRVGEHTGRLDEMLLRSAQVHESQARVTLDRLVGVLPVLMILALAAVIGFIVAGLVLAVVEFQTTGVGP
ncbi:MAG: type II secretion system F family protein, partial [Phycisphaerae bacterium]